MTSPNENNAPAPEKTGGKLSDLIMFVGDENVKVQYVANALKSSSTNKKGETTIAFWTRAVTTNDIMRPKDDSNVGIIMWIPKKKLDEFLKS